jgi:hypothetical protein
VAVCTSKKRDWIGAGERGPQAVGGLLERGGTGPTALQCVNKR